jgi:uncharacterized protein (TIGR00730 family)
MFASAADALGRTLARRGLGLVYGGAHVGLMGRIADAALAAGGHVTGVIPQALVDHEIAHTGLSDLHIVASMHERKAVMERLSDGFIALPGGMGTLEEVCEVFTWAQLGLHAKPCALMNVAGYYDPLLALLDGAVAQGFLLEAYRAMVVVDTDPGRLLTRMASYAVPRVDKWIARSET